MPEDESNPVGIFDVSVDVLFLVIESDGTTGFTIGFKSGEPTLKEVREGCYIDPIPTARKLGWIP